MGWRADSEGTIDRAKLAVDTGLFTLFEYEDGVFRLSREPRFTRVGE